MTDPAPLVPTSIEPPVFVQPPGPLSVDLTAPTGDRRPTEATTTVVLQEDISAILLMEMAWAANAPEGTNTEYVVVLWGLLLDALDKDELGRFKTWTKTVNADIGEIAGWIGDMVRAISNRPTEGQSNSPTGLPETIIGSTEPGESVPAIEHGTASAV